MSVRPPILDRVEEAGYKVFDTGAYDINLIGIRSQARTAGAFDDKMVVVFKDSNGVWTCHWMACTTDPGIPWLEGPMKDTGCAILVPEQYRSVYTLDMHRGKYRALCQRKGKVKIYRDNNRDEVLDMDPENVAEGYYGINIHRALSNGVTQRVGKFSAGCQVIQDPKAYALLIECCMQQVNYHPTWTSFSYTLLED